MMVDDLNATSNPDPATWAGWHGITYPVIGDGSFSIAGAFAPNGDFGIPCYTILDRELRVQSFAQQSWLDLDLVDSLLDAPIPAVDWPLP